MIDGRGDRRDSARKGRSVLRIEQFQYVLPAGRPPSDESLSMHRHLVFAAIALAAASTADAVLVSSYNFAGAPGDQVFTAPTSVITGLTASNLTRGSGVSANAGAGSINSNSWTTGNSPDVNDYYQFAITVGANYELTLDNLTFSETRSGTGIRNFTLRSSTDSFSTFSTLATIDVPDNTSTRPHDISLSSLGTLLEGTTVTFRLYGYAAEAATGTWRLTPAVNVYGTVAIAAIPEPTAALFGSLLAGAFGLMVARRPAGRE